MLTVFIGGGLGNQMYQYALYRTLLERGRDVYMDISPYDHQKERYGDFRKYELADVFNITERLAPKMSNLKYFMLRVVKKLKVPGLMNMYVNKGYFQQEVLEEIHDGILWGTWGSFKYSAEIEDILRKEFTFKRVPTGEAAKLLDEVRNCNSVSISVRRGDYLKLSHIFEVLPVDYYTNAIRYIQERVPNAKFFCVSNDIEYCKETYGNKYNIKFVHVPADNDAFDMQLISQCKHNIIANSTFSIWGAWLNQNPGKIVLRPEKFGKINDYGTEDWIVIPSENDAGNK